ncbi:hypothetical protein [Iningainema tapete]|nr:hypothetical protein [Iningainema tapete]
MKVAVKLEQAIHSLPNPTAWLRRIIESAAWAEGIYQGEEC